MGHEAIIYGMIEGSHWRFGDRFSWSYELNQKAIAEIPVRDPWPWLVQGMFAIPAPWPMGTYRSQIIHLGASIKDEPGSEAVWELFITKFEAVLRTLYWHSATLHLRTDFIPHRIYRWVPTESSTSQLFNDPPHPVTEWHRSISPPLSQPDAPTR